MLFDSDLIKSLRCLSASSSTKKLKISVDNKETIFYFFVKVGIEDIVSVMVYPEVLEEMNFADIKGTIITYQMKEAVYC